GGHGPGGGLTRREPGRGAYGRIEECGGKACLSRWVREQSRDQRRGERQPTCDQSALQALAGLLETALERAGRAAEAPGGLVARQAFQVAEQERLAQPVRQPQQLCVENLVRLAQREFGGGRSDLLVPRAPLPRERAGGRNPAPPRRP